MCMCVSGVFGVWGCSTPAAAAPPSAAGPARVAAVPAVQVRMRRLPAFRLARHTAGQAWGPLQRTQGCRDWRVQENTEGWVSSCTHIRACD